MSDARTPQGILAIAVRPEDTESLPSPTPGRPLAVGWHVQDPGNLGALIRLAEATGAEFQGVAEKDLASVLEEFSKYF